MQPDNPACYECPKTGSGIHTWTRRDDGTAWCIKCDLNLTVEQANEVWQDYETLSAPRMTAVRDNRIIIIPKNNA